MKINPESLQNTTSSSNTTATKGTSTNKGTEKAASFSSTSSDQIQISELSRQLHAFESSLATSSDFNAGKVEEIKAAISQGKFTVNTGAVADSLLASVQEMLGRQK